MGRVSFYVFLIDREGGISQLPWFCIAVQCKLKDVSNERPVLYEREMVRPGFITRAFLINGSLEGEKKTLGAGGKPR